MRRMFAGAALAAALAACGGKKDETPAVAAPAAAVADDPSELAVKPVAPSNYADPAAWLCRPGVSDACAADASATTVAADGKLKVETFVASKDAPIDCFYVYPTVSRDPTPNSDMTPGPEDQRAAALQVARFGSVCRIYAPLYRQTTLTALVAMLQGKDQATDREMAYADIKAAWTHYMTNDNAGRGVVLIGHDQGAGLLSRLIANDIEGTPTMNLVVSVILTGTNVATRPNGAAGGTFREMGACVSSQDLGCVISYSSFRADAPPTGEALFGRTDESGMVTVCSNPAELDDSGGELKPMLPSTHVTNYGAEPQAWAAGAQVTTPLVAVPGLLSAKCVKQGAAAWLAITVNADPADARTDSIVGDVVGGPDQKPLPNWGLHLIDPNLALGNLVAVVKQQADSYRSREISRLQHPEAH